MIIAIASDRSLAGAYNANIVKRLFQEVAKDREAGVETMVICIGRQIAQAATRVQGLHVVAVYQDFPDHPDADQLRPILNTAIERFIVHDVDAVDLLYTYFYSTIRQELRLQRILPAGFSEVEVPPEITRAVVEPSINELVQATAIRLIEVQLFQAVLEAVASEHSMRMLAMKNATDNASELIEDYTLEYNNARQAAITQELAEISAGAEALNG